MKKTYFFILIGIVCFTRIHGQVYTPESVPNPREMNGTWVSDPDRILSEGTIRKINIIINELETHTSDEIAVVMLKSIGEQIPKDFAHALFNRWGVGKKGKDNGLLILFVLDQRRIEFETGYGMEAVLPDVICKRIQTEYMIPYFTEENYDMGMLEGIRMTAEHLMKPENSAIVKSLKEEEEHKQNVVFGMVALFWLVMVVISFSVRYYDGTFTELYKKMNTKRSEIVIPIPMTLWIVLYVVIPFGFLGYVNFTYSSDDSYTLLAIGSYAYLTFIVNESRIRKSIFIELHVDRTDYYGKYKSYAKINAGIWLLLIFFPVPLFIYVIWYLFNQKRLRNHPRNCDNCKHLATKLDETTDNSFLEKYQLLEEELKSVDYDVWHCKNCGTNKVLSYINTWSRYSNCSRCNARTYYLDSDRTVKAATYESPGTGERIYLCKNCGHKNVETYDIPKLTKSSSSAGSSRSGSFGGGRSGGGGAGSSW
ncbi:MAG: TPM domain-containing protein [Cytophagaceae bacterium]|nr:TPM domain-containing protein [Cytophagaceae bacterium]MDW8457049.1 TPM domain-containing protein [Cytophagaceae bacterium]